jgi:threonine/homoserine/homoserine lactone efflux protein
MSLESLLLLAIAISLLCFKPGPGMMTIISRALNSGFLPAFFMVLGIVTIEALYFVLSITSYSIIEAHADLISNTTKSFAVVYLLFLGIKGLSNAKLKGNEVTANVGKKAQLAENFTAGAIVTACNPYVILFYAAVVPGILDVTNMTMSDHMTAITAITLINLVLLSSQALLASHIKGLFKKPELIIRINQFSSICFIGIALFMTYTLMPIYMAELGFGNF